MVSHTGGDWVCRRMPAEGRIVSCNAPTCDMTQQKHSCTTNSIGVSATHEVEEGDDAFDQYRKRMMLAYRFRPNPLNNPRRAYY